MRRWYFRSLALAVCGVGFFNSPVAAQDSRPVPETIRVKTADDPGLPPLPALKTAPDAPTAPAKGVELPSLDLPKLEVPKVDNPIPANATGSMPALALPAVPNVQLPQDPELPKSVKPAESKSVVEPPKLELPNLEAPQSGSGKPADKSPIELPKLDVPVPPSPPKVPVSPANGKSSLNSEDNPIVPPSLDPKKPVPLGTTYVKPLTISEEAPPIPNSLKLPNTPTPAASSSAKGNANDDVNLSAFNELPPLSVPSAMTPPSGQSLTPSPILPAKLTTTSSTSGNLGEPGMLQLPTNPERVGAPNEPQKKKPFWDPNCDPARDQDVNACKEYLGISADMPVKPKWWLDVDYLHYFTPRGRLPALLYGGMPSSASTPANPVMGRTFPLYLNSGPGSRTAPGVEVALGTWLEPSLHWGIDVTTMTLFDQSTEKQFGSAGDLYLLRPFRDADTNTPQFLPIAGAGNPGGINIQTNSRFDGQEIHLLYDPHFEFLSPGMTMYFMFGYRHFNLSDDLQIQDYSIYPNQPATIATYDHFSTHNDFNGGQIAMKTSYQASRWSLDFTSKISLGTSTQNVYVNGFANGYSPSSGPVGQPGGFLALPTNIGEYQRQRLAFAPEVGLKFNYKFTNNLIGSIGYNFVYLSSVVRPGDVIDTTINSNYLPFTNGNGSQTQRPGIMWRDDSYWTQGLSIGLTLQY